MCSLSNNFAILDLRPEPGQNLLTNINYVACFAFSSQKSLIVNLYIISKVIMGCFFYIYIQKISPAIQAFISVYSNELSDTNLFDKCLYLTWYESNGKKQ